MNRERVIITRYRLTPSENGKYIGFEVEGPRGERYAFNFLPEVAQGLGLDLQLAAINAEVNEKGVEDDRQG